MAKTSLSMKGGGCKQIHLLPRSCVSPSGTLQHSRRFQNKILVS